MLRETIRNERSSSEGRGGIVALLTAVKAGDHVTVREMCLADRSLVSKIKNKKINLFLNSLYLSLSVCLSVLPSLSVCIDPISRHSIHVEFWCTRSAYCDFSCCFSDGTEPGNDRGESPAF